MMMQSMTTYDDAVNDYFMIMQSMTTLHVIYPTKVYTVVQSCE